MGDWDAAIAAAPAVSLAYWADLAAKRAEAIAREGGDAEQASRMLLVAGRPAAAAAALAAAGREDDAFAVACAADAGGFPAPGPSAETAAPRGARSASADFGETGVFAETPENAGPAGPAGKLAPLSPLGGASGNALASLSPLPPLRVAGKMKMLAAAARAESARATETANLRDPLGEEAEARFSPGKRSVSSPNAANVSASARSVREAQASRRLAHGDAVGAAAARLSVGDATGAAKALLRGAQVEMAAALMLSLPSGSFARAPEPLGLVGIAGGLAASDAAHALLAARACELGEWDLALEAAAAVEHQAERRWRSRLVAATRAAVDPEAARAEGFAERCARASGGWDKEETRVSPLGLVVSKVTRLRARRRRRDRRRDARRVGVRRARRRRPVGALGRRRFAPVARRAERHRPRSQRRPARPEDARGSHDAAVLPLRDHAAVRGVHARAALAVPPRQKRAQIEQNLFALPAPGGVCVAAGAQKYGGGVPRGRRGRPHGDLHGGGGEPGAQGRRRRGAGRHRRARGRRRQGAAAARRRRARKQLQRLRRLAGAPTRCRWRRRCAPPPTGTRGGFTANSAFEAPL
jgi:hypothetical protein